MWISLLCLSLTRTPLPLRSVASLSLAMLRSSTLALADTLVGGVLVALVASPLTEPVRDDAAVLLSPLEAALAAC
jgi:hypothetical protein